MRSIRLFALTFVVLTLLAGLAGCQPATPAAPANPTSAPAQMEQPTQPPAPTPAPPQEPTQVLTTLRYGGQLYPEEYLLMGDPQFWADYGLKVEHTLFSSATEGNQALISGAVDVNVASDSRTVALFGALPDQTLIIGVVQRGDRYSTIVRPDSPYQTWYDLKVKKVALRNGTGAEQVVRRYFEQVGDLKWEDFTAWEPTPAIAEAQGAGRVMMSYGEVALTPVLLNTTVKYAESHRAELVHFLAAHLAKARMIKEDPQKAAEIAAQAASAQGATVSPDTFQRIFERVDFSLDLDDNVIAALQDTGQFLYTLGEIKEQPEFKWDVSYLEEAQKLVDGK